MLNIVNKNLKGTSMDMQKTDIVFYKKYFSGKVNIFTTPRDDERRMRELELRLINNSKHQTDPIKILKIIDGKETVLYENGL